MRDGDSACIVVLCLLLGIRRCVTVTVADSTVVSYSAQFAVLEWMGRMTFWLVMLIPIPSLLGKLAFALLAKP